jgi:superfamily II DNA or RNA helicase
VNYQQQWLGELCHKPIGLRLSPDLIFTGTPAALEAEREATGSSPAVLVMTYTALAQTGSGTGKGGFDQDSIEMFLQGNGVRYVILDEVHKVAEDLRSVSADVTRLMTEWLRDGSLRGVIGFSGTAAAYRRRFPRLGLQLVYTMPAADLIACGFVAPFAEVGVPFA